MSNQAIFSRLSTASRLVSVLGETVPLREVGNKAYNLNRIQALGLSVPPAFFVTNLAFQRFLGEARLGEKIRHCTRNLEAGAPDRLRRAARKIQRLITTSPLPGEIGEAIRAMRKGHLPGATLIVRSSALGEDSTTASFAGQLDSVSDIGSDPELEAALLQCWASLWSQRSLSYQLTSGRRLNGLGVVVQRLVPSQISGVLFTLPPVGLEAVGRDDLIVEYCQGHGQSLVSGRITPGRLAISRTDYQWRELEVPATPVAAPTLLFDRELVRQLARSAIELEELFGAAQDIEWTIDSGGRLFFLQSRPITTPGHSRQRPGTVVKLREKRAPMVQWSNANLCENYPKAVSPLLYSIAATGYYHYFRNLLKTYGISGSRIRQVEPQLRSLVGVHGGHLYYNLTNIHEVLRIAPFGDLLARYFDQFIGAGSQSATGSPKRAKLGAAILRPAALVKLSRVVTRTTWQYLFLPARVAEFERIADEFAARTSEEQLRARSLPRLLEDLRGFLEIRYHRWTNAALADAAAMVSNGGLRHLLEKGFPREAEALHSALLNGLPDIVSSEPVVQLWELACRIRNDSNLSRLFRKSPRQIQRRLRQDDEFAEFQESLAQYLSTWGFRCTGELMLTVPSYAEEPQAVLEILRNFAARETESPSVSIQRQAAKRLAETERVIRDLSGRRLKPYVLSPDLSLLFRVLLRWTHRSLSLRERCRLKQAMLYQRCRRIVLTMGERLAAAGQLERFEDVFFLTHPELEKLAAGTEMFPAATPGLVSLRKSAHRKLAESQPPDHLTLAQGCYYTPDGRQSSRDLPLQDRLSGTAACGGTVRGRAAVLTDMSEFGRLQSEDILVAPQTDPGWAPAFCLISGLVVERGGILSHGAIVAREFGIPSVVGVRNAVREIRNGQSVTVDGDRGHVVLGH